MKNRGTSKKVQKFYREQNDLIDNMLSPLNPIDEESEQRQMLKVQSDNKRCWVTFNSYLVYIVQVKIAVYGSGIANVVL